MNSLFAFTAGCIFLIFGGLYGIYEIVTFKGNNHGSKSKSK